MTQPPLDATHTPFSLSLLTSTRHNASKKLIADHAGRPVSDPAHRLGITAGTLEHVRLAGLAELRDLLQRVTTRQALVHGVHTGSAPGELCQLVTLAQLAKLGQNGTVRPAGIVTRSLADLDYPDGVRLLMFDVDPYPGIVTPQSAAELIQELAQIWPGFAEVGWLATVSTRSAIKDKQTDAWVTPPHGFHVYVLATGDVARFRELARVKLWLADTGYCKLASPHVHTGVSAVLERCVIDLSVFSPERLDYVAGAIIAKSEPFYQDRPPGELSPGAVLDLDGLPEVTDEEHQQYAALVQAERLRVKPEREAQVRAHIHQASPTLDTEAIAHEITARLERTDHGILTPDHPLVFDGRRSVITAGTVAAALDGKRLADPFEPDYRDGSDAIFHWNHGRWLINSFAHGLVKTYHLEPPPPEPDEDDLQDLLTHAPAPPDMLGDRVGIYQATRTKLLWWRESKDGEVAVPLTNFAARITADVSEDDGSGDLVRSYALEVTQGARTTVIFVPASDYGAMQWVAEQLGARCYLMAGPAIRDRARCAIQELSPAPEQRRVFVHTGWRTIDDAPYFLTASGALGAGGLRTDIHITLRDKLARYALPAPPTGGALLTALQASLDARHAAPDHAMLPILATAYLAPLREFLAPHTPDFCVWVLGPSGHFKTEYATLAQAHFGAFTRLNLPAAFESTGNGLERLQHSTKDVLLTVDDFYPSTDRKRKEAMDNTAQRLLRGTGNSSSRTRMRRDTTQQADLLPRCMALATGEILPDGHSTNARLFLVTLAKLAPDLLKTQGNALATCQNASEDYPLAMSAYIQWIARHHTTLARALPHRFVELRTMAQALQGHTRDPGQVAHLYLAWEVFTDFAALTSALTRTDREVLLTAVWTTLLAGAQDHAATLAELTPTHRFFALLADGLASKAVYLANREDGAAPPDGEHWGWIPTIFTDQDGTEEHGLRRPSTGALVGRLDDEHVYLIPETTYQYICKAAKDTGGVFPASLIVLRKMLADDGVLVTTKQAGKTRYTTEVRFDGNDKPRVMKILRTALEAFVATFSGDSGNSGDEDSGPNEQRNQDVASPVATNATNATFGREGKPRQFSLLSSPSFSVEEEEEKEKSRVYARACNKSGISGISGDTPTTTRLDTQQNAVATFENGTRESGDSRKSGDRPAPAPIAVGDWCFLFAVDGTQQNSEPYLCTTIEPGQDGQAYARFLEVAGGWLVDRCEKAPEAVSAPPAPPCPIAPLDACWLLSAEGTRTNTDAYLCKRLAQDPVDGQWYAQFLETGEARWPVNRCEKESDADRQAAEDARQRAFDQRPDVQAFLDAADKADAQRPALCPRGGVHQYLKGPAPRRCTACNALEPAREVLNL